MTLLSIKDDFRERTLANIPGIWGKLDHLADLKEHERYVHWGLTRIYGDEATQRTLGEVHREVFLEVLRTPVRTLLEDLSRSAAAKGSGLRDSLESILRNPKSLLPPDMGGGSAVHFNSIIAALSLLVVQL